MNIQSTRRKPEGVRTSPSVIIADEAGDNAVWVPGRDLESLLSNGASEAYTRVLLDEAAGALGDQAGLPLTLVSIGLRHQGLYERAMRQTLRPGDQAMIMGLPCTLISAISAATGYPTTAGIFKLMGETFFAVGESQAELALATRAMQREDEEAFTSFADAIDASLA